MNFAGYGCRPWVKYPVSLPVKSKSAWSKWVALKRFVPVRSLAGALVAASTLAPVPVAKKRAQVGNIFFHGIAHNPSNRNLFPGGQILERPVYFRGKAHGHPWHCRIPSLVLPSALCIHTQFLS